MDIKPLIIGSKEIYIMKPYTSADYLSKTVLTDSSWQYVELWLTRQNSKKSNDALFYWKQAYEFFRATEILSIESKPLTAYYCCLNAAKALLSIRGDDSINLDRIGHGITSDRKQWQNKTIKGAEVIFQSGGVLNELSRYYGENTQKTVYTVYDLLYNIPCVHRTFSITFGCSELFIPISTVQYFIDTKLCKGWGQFKVDDKYSNNRSLKNISNKFERLKFDPTCYLYRHKKRFCWDRHLNIEVRVAELSKYQKAIRKDLFYIKGDKTLWYIKKTINRNHIVDRQDVTLIFAVMHWLSELVRYNPEKFNKLMQSKQNWLIREFMEKALYQYIDEISCEMTETNIMTTGYR